MPATLATSPALERSLRVVRQRRVAVAAVARFGRAALVALLLAGTFALIARALGLSTTQAAFGCFAAVVLAAGVAVWQALRQRPHPAAAAVWLDVHSGASGGVVTEAELGASSWSERSPQAFESALRELPPPPWLEALRALAPGLAFAALAVWIPIGQLTPGPPPMVADRAMERLEEKLAALDEALALDPELAQELELRVERIEASATSDRPDATFEAIDRLEARLDAEAQRALDAAQQAAEQLQQAASDPHLEHADEALQSALASLREAGLTKGLSSSAQQALGATLELPEGVQLSSLQLAQLSNELRESMQAQLKQLAAGRMIDAKALERLAQAQAGEAGELGEFDPDHVCDENCRKPGGT